MVNTSAPLFGTDTYKNEILRQQAELYSRLYAFAAEDFVAHPDLKQFIALTVECFESIQLQLETLTSVLASHSHNIPPHTHSIPPHTHISSSPGSPSSTNILGYATLPTPLTTQFPLQAASIKWTLVAPPLFVNTTGSIENLEGNKIILGPTMVGPAEVYKRRLKTPEILNTTISIPPILKLDVV